MKNFIIFVFLLMVGMNGNFSILMDAHAAGSTSTGGSGPAGDGSGGDGGSSGSSGSSGTNDNTNSGAGNGTVTTVGTQGCSGPNCVSTLCTLTGGGYSWPDANGNCPVGSTPSSSGSSSGSSSSGSTTTTIFAGTGISGSYTATGINNCPAGSPPSGTPNTTNCVCNTGIWNGTTCSTIVNTCPAGSPPSGTPGTTNCVCDSGNWNGTSCSASTGCLPSQPPLGTPGTTNCACNSGTWNGTSCTTVNTCPAGSPPSGTPDTTNCACNIGIWNGTVCSVDITNPPVVDSSLNNSCGTKRIVVNADNTIYSNRFTGKAAYFEYGSGSHCACSYQDYAAIPPANNGQVIAQTLPPDTFQKISSQNNSNKIEYSPVPIANDSKEGTVDGRVWTLFNANKSQCGCPNLNEKYESLIPDFLGKPQGASCKPAFTDQHQVLMTYNPSVHANQVIPSSQGPLDIDHKVVTKIALPIKTGGTKTLPYTRRIWACSTGYKVVDLTGTPHCEFTAAEHQCSAGTSNDTASAVSSGVSGSSLSAKFDHTINKKLACCLNAYTKGNQNLKFDCIDNSSTVDTSFDALWTSKDVDGDGGQLNAVVLSDSKGKPISGFYTLDGSRCSGMSEFGGELKPRTVNPTRSVTGQIETVDPTGASSASPLLLPSGDAYSFIRGKPGFNKVPTTQEELNRCPILVRAAMKVGCGANEAIPAVQTTITESGKKRCTAASKISIHVQVMQLTKIAGMAPMKTFDTVADPKSAATINIGKIVGSKNSGECADGAKRVGSQCVYQ